MFKHLHWICFQEISFHNSSLTPQAPDEFPDRIVMIIKPSIASDVIMAFRSCSICAVPPTAEETAPDIYFITNSLSVS
jgi:hypothetical protein